ncbi:hypothetical protein E2C01_047391 [Portunus trituberculatus]|uniref:Uncharacterized protein n=1 Tax=Portunus trituberculatus TaxID=210409 RepID=A0A5B7G7F9_PORTR|nr:hypothetical protein [Portunus trituberculatus]
MRTRVLRSNSASALHL